MKQNLDVNIQQKIRSLLPDNNSIKLLCVGRMVKDKGIEELIHVFEKLQKTYQVQLILIGPFEQSLDALSQPTLEIIKTNRSITHINWSDEIEYFMNAADVLIHPSHREGFPNVILQAGAMRLPVICSDIPGNIDIIQNEKTGLLFQVKNETDLQFKIKYAINNQKQMKVLARSLFTEVTELYDRNQIQKAILESYNSLLRNI